MAELSQNEIDDLRVGLKQHFESRLHAIEKQVDIQNKVFDAKMTAMNEWRDAVRDRDDTYLPVSEHESWKVVVDRDFVSLKKEIQELREFRAAIDAKASMSAVYIGYLFTAIGIGLSILAIFVRFVR